VIDVLDKPGGQCSELYPAKPIYDIPALPEVSGQELTDRLLEQAKPFNPQFSFGQMLTSLERIEDGRWRAVSNTGRTFLTKVVVIAAGGGSFQSKRPPIKGLDGFEGISVFYSIRDQAVFSNKRVLIVGGGDSALDWTLALASNVSHLTLMHRREVFRGAPNTVSSVKKLVEDGFIDFKLGQMIDVAGNAGQITHVIAKGPAGLFNISCDVLLPFFGLTIKLGPVGDWGLELDGDRVKVDVSTFQTNFPGVYAIGDINTYPGKLKLILSGFHEAALMAHDAYSVVYPNERLIFQYTTSSTSIHKKLGRV